MRRVRPRRAALKRFATLAKANRENYEVEAAGKQAINQAINTLSEAQITLQAKLALIQALPKIIEESVRPMEKIDSIRIVQVEGLKTGGGGGSGAPARREESRRAGCGGGIALSRVRTGVGQTIAGSWAGRTRKPESRFGATERDGQTPSTSPTGSR